MPPGGVELDDQAGGGDRVEGRVDEFVYGLSRVEAALAAR